MATRTNCGIGPTDGVRATNQTGLRAIHVRARATSCRCWVGQMIELPHDAGTQEIGLSEDGQRLPRWRLEADSKLDLEEFVAAASQEWTAFADVGGGANGRNAGGGAPSRIVFFHGSGQTLISVGSTALAREGDR